MLLGAAAGGGGSLFRQYDFWIQRFGGLLLILFGLQFSGFVNFPLFSGASGFRMPRALAQIGYLRPFFIGVVFATTWSPCIGVVLGSILTIAAVDGQAIRGAVLLFVYSLGISIPLVIVSLTLVHAPRYLAFISKNTELISKITGLVLVLLGILLLTNTYRFVNSWLGVIAIGVKSGLTL